MGSFEQHLVRGGDYLRRDRVNDARDEFLSALELRPDEPKALARLGLCYFRLSAFGEALPVYEKLVELEPEDASFWLNLGLVHLKLGDAPRAIDELGRSRDLDPSQIRTVSYLGLAYARNGQYADAYAAFLHAGEEALAQEMEQYLDEERRAQIRRRVENPTLEAEPEPEPEPEPEAEPEAEAEPDRSALRDFSSALEESSRVDEPAEGGLSQPEPDPDADMEMALSSLEPQAERQDVAEDTDADRQAAEGAEPASLGRVALRRIAVPRDIVEVRREPEDAGRSAGNGRGEIAGDGAVKSATVAEVIEAALPSGAVALARQAAAGHHAPRPLSEFATSRLVRPEEGDHPFEIGAAGVLIVRVKDRVMSRTERVIVSGGELGFEPAARRVRGASTDEVFGDDERRMFFVSGQGFLVASPGGEHFTAVTLDDDILYLRESLVFAFEDQLRWESGHVPGSDSRIHVVQFRGNGCVAMRTRKPLLSVKLATERVLYVDAEVLAGWVGRVVPRLVAPAAGGESSAPFVECSGEGVVLVEDHGG